MNTQQNAASAADTTVRGGAFYRLVWKWHFLASLYVLPFMLILSVTGALYLYKPQIEAWIYADRLTVDVSGDALTLEDQVAALETHSGVTRLRGIMVYDDPARTTRVEFNDTDQVRSYAWINPYTTEILAVTPRDATLMRMLKKFHGELLLGGFGTKFVELSAHWAIVMMVTGIVLWWPRGKRNLREATRLPSGTGRKWWREAHMFTGMLAFVLITPILLTGLPWTDVWGGGLSYVQTQTGQKSQSLRFGGNAPKSSASEGETIAYARVIEMAREQGISAPYEMRPPRRGNDAFWLRSASVSRYEQTEIIVDRYSGEQLARVDFADNPVVAKAVSLGISLHQGELFGTLNLALNTLAAALGVFLSVSGFVIWWKRRPVGTLGVPAAPEARLGTGMAITVVALMILLPLMGLSLIVALILDWLIFRRLGWFQGARPAAAE